MADETIEIQRKRTFTVLENDVLEDRHLTANDVMVFVTLAYHADRDGVSFPSTSTLAKEARCSRATIFRSLARLTKAGYVQRTARKGPRGGQTSNSYLITGRQKVAATPPVSQGDPPRLTVTPPLTRLNEPARESAEAAPAPIKVADPDPRTKEEPRNTFLSLRDLFTARYLARTGKQYAWSYGRDGALLKRLIAARGLGGAREAIVAFFEAPACKAYCEGKGRGWGFGSLSVLLNSEITTFLAQEARHDRVCACGWSGEVHSPYCPVCGKRLPKVAKVA